MTAVIMLGCFGMVFLTRWLNQRALKPLDANEKARVGEALSQQGYSILVLIGIIALINLLMRPAPFALTLVAIGAWALGLDVYNFRKLRKLQVVESYVRSWLAVQTFELVGVIAAIAAVVLIGK